MTTTAPVTQPAVPQGPAVGGCPLPGLDTAHHALTRPKPVAKQTLCRPYWTRSPAATGPSDGDSDTKEADTAGSSDDKPGSMSSTVDSFIVTTVEPAKLQKASRPRDAPARQHQPRRSSRDPEKAPVERPRDVAGQANGAAHIAYAEDEEMDDTRRRHETHALKILLYFSFPCALLSTLNAGWTFVSLFITVLTQPVRLCARRPTFGQQLGGLLGPALNLQLKSIYTPLPPHADEDTTYRAWMLVVVMLVSPFASLAMMLAAWVVAVYWFASAMVGDPAGTDKRDDGCETILLLRDAWERWLVRGVRQD